MKAPGTKLIVLPARKRTDRNGIVFPESATQESHFAKVIARGPNVSQVSPKVEVVVFNPLHCSTRFEDAAGVELNVLDEEAVLAELSLKEAVDDFGAVFP